MRGIAALVVLIHHALLVIPDLAAPFWIPGADGGPFHWLFFSPLHTLWGGTEAVYVFFILSGIVLTLPVLARRRAVQAPNQAAVRAASEAARSEDHVARSANGAATTAKSTSPRFNWAAYYPSRLLRLYLPVLGGVVLAVALALLVPRVIRPGQSLYLDVHAEPVSLASAAHNAFLLDGTTTLNSPLWSLQWEVLFSLFLPLYIAVAIWMRRLWWLVVAGVLVVSTAGVLTDRLWAFYLPVFLLGAVIAVRMDLVYKCGEWMSRRRHPDIAWSLLLSFSFIGLTSYWTAGLFLQDPLRRATMMPVTFLAAGSLVVMAIAWGRARTVLERPRVQWLGRVSFSLYLVHEPVLVSVAFLLPTSLAWLTIPIAIPLALGAAALFFRFVERPSHRVAKAVSGAIAARRRVPA